MFKKYLTADIAYAQLDGNVNSTQTQIVFKNGHDVPSSGNWIATLVQYGQDGYPTKVEKVYVSSLAGQILTVSRGYDGSQATTFNDGDYVFLNVTSAIIKDLQDEVERIATGAQFKSEKNQANGYAGLGADGKIDVGQIPALKSHEFLTVTNAAARYDLTTSQVQLGDEVLETTTGETYVLIATDPSQAGSWLFKSDTTPSWSAIGGKPTTIAGYGITDAYTKTEVDTALGNYYTKTAADAKYVALTGAQNIDGEKTFSSSPIVPTPTTGNQASNKDYSDTLNPDFYQYSIVRTVASGNITVALKNFEGNDPTPTKPVKIMIGGVVRTITSALGMTSNGGSNLLNLGSSELATKEVDLFPYLKWNTSDTNVNIVISRLPHGNIWSDFVFNSGSEKGTLGNTNNVSTDPVVNIGRFNAILSGGGAYTWSIPATSVIVNSPIYDIRNTLTFDSTVTASGSMTVSSTVKGGSYYRIQGDMMDVYAIYTMTLGGTASNEVRFTLPFSINNVGAWMYEGGGSYWNGSTDVLLVASMDATNKNIVRVKKADGTIFTLGTGQEIKLMVRGRI